MNNDKKNKITEIIVIYSVIIISILLLLYGIKGYGIIPYSTFKAQFSKDVFKSFPKLNIIKSSQICTDFVGGYEYLGYCGADILYECNENSFAKKLDYIENNTIAIYNSYDTCLVSVYKMDTICNCEEKYYPVYNEFDSPYGNDTKDVLSDSVQYYVFDCKEGRYFKQDSILNQIGNRTEYLRKKTYQHGFSNGAIVDRKKLKIVYWVFVW
ncbi:MAG: hypothetical protein LBN95_11650 [Prevotellaceae bacterium]|jgi:hypothetical protein|nr:hypothetical protein [Prevotellaceae bacterium]